MDFEFSDEAVQLRESVKRWLERDYGFERRRRIIAEGGHSREAYASLAGLGLCGLWVDEEFGGLSLGPAEAIVIMEELGRGLVLEPFLHTLMASSLVSFVEDRALRASLGARLAGKGDFVVLAYLERGNRYAVDRSATVAGRGVDGWTLNGGKCLVAGGDMADALIVPAMNGGRLGLFLVEADAVGLSSSPYTTMDGSRAADVTFRNTPAVPLIEAGQRALDYALDCGTAALCAESVGTMERTLETTAEYLRTRKQFGAELASFQSLRHRIADMKMQLELARSMAYYAALKLDAAAPERRIAVSQAKYQIGASSRFVGQEAVQLHGGIGLTDEYVVSHCFKRLTQIELSLGDSMHHLGIVSSQMKETAGVYD